MAWTTPGTATAGEVLTAAFWNEQVRDNMVELAPFFAAWTSFTPTWTDVTLGTTGLNNTGAYLKIGRLYLVRFELTLGTGGSFSTSPRMTLPNSASIASGYSTGTQLGNWGAVDSLTTGYLGTIRPHPSESTRVSFLIPNTSGTYAVMSGVAATVPFTWGATDTLNGQFFFEAAS